MKLYVYMYICMYIYIYIYTHTFVEQGLHLRRSHGGGRQHLCQLLSSGCYYYNQYCYYSSLLSILVL